MAKTAQIYCKTCKKKTKHWDNKGTEKEKTLGMFVCSICKTPWTPKPKTGQPTQPQAQPAQTTQNTSSKITKIDTNDINFVKQSFYGGWAKDFVVVLMDKGVVKTKEEAVTTYKYFLKEIGIILNGGVAQAIPGTNYQPQTTQAQPKEEPPAEPQKEVKEPPAEPQKEVKEPQQQTPQKETSDLGDLGDLNLSDLNIEI